MPHIPRPINVETGEFPYPLTGGAEESRYLTWVRNHSNYMAERGFLDYFRLVGVLLRGIAVNFVTLLPYLLLVSLALGLIHNQLLDRWNGAPSATYSEAYFLTPWVLGFAAFWVLAFPVIARFKKVISFKKSLKTGASTSPRLRDLFERSFGGLLLVIVAVVVFESFPLLAHFFHNLPAWSAEWTFPTAAGIGAVLVAANKVLPLLSGVLQKLAVLFIGAVGLLVPLLIILFVVDFLVYDPRYEGFLNVALLLVPVVLAVLIVLAGLVGIGSFKARAYGKLFLILVAIAALLIVAVLPLMAAGYKDYSNFFFVAAWAIEIWMFSTLAVDVNHTSINGLYRDRLASAFLVGRNTKGDVDIEQDIDLQEICRYQAHSTAPYHLVNVALNLQGSKDISVRERNSDFFVFSKKFIGSERTGYCRSEHMERVYPQIDLGTAMAISAAAASPNMGQATNPLMVAFMTLLNIRLGFWIPNPGRLEKQLKGQEKHFAANVFPEELREIERRREQAYGSKTERPLGRSKTPTVAHNLVGIGFSGGGIRSATINLGIAQALHAHGVFDHIDYMSTVSGGGYLGSSISTLMRFKTLPFSEIDGDISIEETSSGEKLVKVLGTTPGEKREYRYTSYAELHPDIKTGEKIKARQPLLARSAGSADMSLMDRFAWRVRPGALLRELISSLNEKSKWINLSDGGHIENLAAIELLRRRCKFIIIGDGEADPKLYFNGLATLMRYARIDLGIEIDINLDELRLKDSENKNDRRSRKHHAFGRIFYPGEEQPGHLLYLKSSFTGDEDEVVMEYRHRKPDFPHESTADQFFDEGQFEAYRDLGQHIGECALKTAPRGQVSFADLETWFNATDNQ